MVLIDTSSVWGQSMLLDVDGDGAPERKPDGVHVCPQGAARFSAWFVDELAVHFDGINAPFPSAWVSGTWTADRRYDTPTGACTAVS